MPVVFAFLLDCHPRESGGPGQATLQVPWILAFAGMTFEKVYRTRLPNLAAMGPDVASPARMSALPILRSGAKHGRGALPDIHCGSDSATIAAVEADIRRSLSWDWGEAAGGSTRKRRLREQRT